MSLKAKYLNAKFLKTLEPLSKLSMDKLNELASKSTIETLPPARILFRQGERDARSIYILSGQIELTVAGSKPETLKAKTLEAKYPVAQSLPRPSTGRTKTNCELMYIDTDLLEILLEGDDIPSGNYEVTEINAEDDANGWMLKFLQSRAFLSLPTDNIQKLLMKMQEITAKRGEVILKQGESNDYYYIVKHGKCSVTRRPTPSAESVQVAVLSVGDGFGEEALITDGKRNATVKMQEDGALMRLTKNDFIELLVEPLIQYIDEDELKSRAKSGDMLIDVRQHKDFMEGHLDGAVNIPLSMLRLKLSGLNENREYLIYCENSNRSSAAAFLIIQHGLVCRVLKGGYQTDNKVTTKSDDRPMKSGTSMADIIANLESVGSRMKTAQTKSTTEKTKAENTPTPAVKQPQASRSASEDKVKSDQNKSDNRAKLFQIEARKAKEQLENLNQEKAQQEAARQRAEAELKRLKAEEEKRNESLKKLAEQQRQTAEQVKRNAEIERQKLQAEITEAKKQAEEEIKKYRNILQQQQDHQSNLERSKQEFELRAQEAIAAARQRAEQEAAVIKQQAESETNKLREELEKTKREVAQRIEALRAEETRKTEQEAQQRSEEAKKIEQEILKRTEETKKAEQAIHIKQSQANQAIRDSIEKARKKAAQEADAIRRQALEEAQSLQAELEAKRLEVTKEIESIRTEAERQRQSALNEAKKHAEEFISQTSADIQRKAMEEADAIRQETLVEARRLHEELEEKRRLIDLHATKENERMMHTLQLSKQQADEIRRQAEAEAERIRLQAIQEAENQKRSQATANTKLQNDLRNIELPGFASQITDSCQETDTEIEAKKLAEQIIVRLERADLERKKDKDSQQNSHGMQLSTARLRKMNDKTILEGDEDIFIFKEPAFDPHFDEDDDEIVEPTPARSKRKQSSPGLPDFILDDADKFDEIKYVDATRDEAEFLIVAEEARVNSNGPISEFSDFELHNSQNYTNPFVEKSRKRNQKSRVIALAATLMIALGGTGSFFYLNKDNNNLAANSEDNKQALNATRMSGIGVDKVQLEKDLINDAEAEFSKLMKKWQKNVDNEKSEKSK